MSSTREGYWSHTPFRCSPTILLQLNEVEGLQIRKDGRSVPVKPLTNAFIISIGHIIEAIHSSIDKFYDINWFEKILKIPLA